jgi:16S rRNA processing protein RimM
MANTSSDSPLAEASVQDGEPTDWVEVGCVARPHGIRGELRIKFHNPDSEILLDVVEVFVRKGDGEGRVMAVRSARPAADGFALMAFEGVTTRSEADALRGAGLSVPRGTLPEAEDGEFYVHDILGAKVVQPDGRVLGEVVDYVSYPTTDVLIVQGTTRYEIPLVDDFVRDIDTAKKVVTVEGVDDFEAG